MDGQFHLNMLDENQAVKCRSLLEAWPSMTHRERDEHIFESERHILEDVFLNLSTDYRVEILEKVKKGFSLNDKILVFPTIK